MRKFRLLALAAAGGSALALASPTLAARTLTVSPGDYVRGGAAGNTIAFTRGANDARLAKVTVYVPLGYGSLLSEPVGSSVGDVAGLGVANLAGNDRLPFRGSVLVDDPAKYVARASAITCAGRITHDAVWVINVDYKGSIIKVPIYVDRVAQGPETGFSSFKLQMCFESGPNSLSPLSLRLFLKEVFRNPGTRGTYTWRAVFVPFAANNTTHDTAAAVEARSLVQLPQQLTIKGRKVKRTVGGKTLTYAQLSGFATRLGVGVPNANVRVRLNGKLVAVVKSRARGAWSTRVRIRGNSVVTFSAEYVYPVKRVDAEGCAGETAPPATRCETATQAPGVVRSNGTYRVRP